MKTLFIKYRSLFAFAFFSLVIVLLTVRTASLANIPGERIDRNRWGLQDYRDAIYYPCRSLLDGNNPYAADRHMNQYPVGQLFPLYSPLTLIIHQPFAWIPFAVSQWIYFALTIAATLLLSALILKFCQLPLRWDSLFALAGFLLMSRAGHMNLALGQSTVQAVIFFLLAMHWAAPKPLRSGLMLALATFKPTFGAILFLFLLARKNYSAAIAGLLIGCLLTLPVFGYLCYLEGGLDSFVDVLTNNSDTFDQHQGRDPRSSFSRLDSYLLLCKISDTETNNLLELGFALSMIVFTGAVIFWKTSRNKLSLQPLITCLILLTTLIAIYHHAYDWLLVAPAVCLLLSSDHLRQQVSGVTRWCLAGLLLIPAANYLATNSLKSMIENDSTAWLAITSINSAALLIAWGWLIIILGRVDGRTTDENNSSDGSVRTTPELRV